MYNNSAPLAGYRLLSVHISSSCTPVLVPETQVTLVPVCVFSSLPGRFHIKSSIIYPPAWYILGYACCPGRNIHGPPFTLKSVLVWKIQLTMSRELTYDEVLSHC